MCKKTVITEHATYNMTLEVRQGRVFLIRSVEGTDTPDFIDIDKQTAKVLLPMLLNLLSEDI